LRTGRLTVVIGAAPGVHASAWRRPAWTIPEQQPPKGFRRTTAS